MVFLFSFLEQNFGFIYSSLSQTFIRIFLGILIFLVGFIIGKLAGRAIYKVLNETEINKFLKDSAGIKLNADHLISNIVTYFIYFLSLVAALEEIGIANIVLYILSSVIIIIILISLFLAIKDFIPNFIAGLYIYSKEHLKEGSQVEIGDIKGKLIHLDLLHVIVKTSRGDVLYIPNSMVIHNRIKIKN